MAAAQRETPTLSGEVEVTYSSADRLHGSWPEALVPDGPHLRRFPPPILTRFCVERAVHIAELVLANKMSELDAAKAIGSLGTVECLEHIQEGCNFVDNMGALWDLVVDVSQVVTLDKDDLSKRIGLLDGLGMKQAYAGCGYSDRDF